jgi:hypothetical protein
MKKMQQDPDWEKKSALLGLGSVSPLPVLPTYDCN